MTDFPGYKVGDDGTVWSRWGTGTRGKMREWKKLTPRTVSHGYLGVTLSRDKKHFQRLCHRLVLEAFRGPCPRGMETRHLNGSPNDNRLVNLQWGTHSENICDKYGHGTAVAGERNGMTKLTETQVREILSLAKCGELSCPKIAKLYGVDRTLIWLIAKRKIWKHIID